MADQVTFRSRDPFVRVPNVTARAEMSPDALGVLVYALSHNRRWRINRDDLSRHFGIGKDRLTRIFRELETLGYREVQRTRRADGTISSLVIWYDKPKDEWKNEIMEDGPAPGYPDGGGPGGKNVEDHHQKMTASSSSLRSSSSAVEVFATCKHGIPWCICDE